MLHFIIQHINLILFEFSQARQLLEQEFKNLLASGTDRTIDTQVNKS